MIYRIYDPVNITYDYFDEYGEWYPLLPEGADVEERPYTEAEAMEALVKLTERLTESYGTKVSLSQAIRTAVIDTERETRTNEENFQ